MPTLDTTERLVQAERNLFEDPNFMEAKLDLLQGLLHEAPTRQVTIWWHELDLLIRWSRIATYRLRLEAEEKERFRNLPSTRGSAP